MKLFRKKIIVDQIKVEVIYSVSFQEKRDQGSCVKLHLAHHHWANTTQTTVTYMRIRLPIKFQVHQ
jgi:hypothetical protein